MIAPDVSLAIRVEDDVRGILAPGASSALSAKPAGGSPAEWRIGICGFAATFLEEARDPADA